MESNLQGGAMPEELKRLTVEEVKGLCKRFGAKLVPGFYGFNAARPNSGCALSFLALRYTQDPSKVREFIIKADSGTVPNIPIDYVSGLEAGFECPGFKFGPKTLEYKMGREDGIALRALVED